MNGETKALPAPAEYRAHFLHHRRTAPPPLPGFSIALVTRNRSAFLREAIGAVLGSATRPFELLIWDNGSDDDTPAVTAAFAGKDPRIHSFRADKNLGTHAYALLFLKAKHHFLVDMDDDILALQKGWDEKVERAFQVFPKLGFLSLDVVQDRFTNGAKPDLKYYTPEFSEGLTLERGPAGGWFAVTPRPLYDRAGGFLYAPGKPFVLEDAVYCQKMSAADLTFGILKNTFAYHGCGAKWNAAFGYQRLWREKYKDDFPRFLPAIDNLDGKELPTLDAVAAAMRPLSA